MPWLSCGEMLMAPRPAASSSKGGMLPMAAANPAMERAGSRPVNASPALRAGRNAFSPGRMPNPRTILLSANAAAKIWSLSGNLPSSVLATSAPIAARTSGRRPMLAGDIRSASGKTISKAIEAAPNAFRRLTTRARSVRGHGHCPMAASDASSISTIRTGWGRRPGA